MNNESPLIPQGSLLEQKNNSRSRVKTAFFCVLGVHVLAIVVALIAQGCKRQLPPAPPEPEAPVPTFESSTLPPVETNMAPPVVEPLPPVVAPEPPPVTMPAPAAQTHAVAKGDSFYSIAKLYHTTMKAVADANPGVDSTKLKIGQTLNIPAAAAPVATGDVAPASGVEAASSQIYTVKSGDNLSKIALQKGTTVKALRAANNLKTDRIKVGDKLKIPGKAVVPVPVEAAPVVPPAAPVVPPVAPPPGGLPLTTPPGN